MGVFRVATTLTYLSRQVSTVDFTRYMEARNSGRKIIVPLDGSASSERALAHALWMMVTQATDNLLLLHVQEATGADTQPTSDALVPTYDDKVLVLINEYATQSSIKVNWERKNMMALDARTAIGEERLRCVSASSGVFCSSTDAVSEAESWGADYVCLGARGSNSSVGRVAMPLGSTADYVLRNAPCSVIVVRKRRPNGRHN